MFFLFSFLTFISCNDNIEVDNNKIQSIDEITLVDGIVKINSKESMNSIAIKYRNNVSEQNRFNEVIKKLQLKGFQPLEPIFDDNNGTQVEEFVKRKIKRLKKRDEDYGLNAIYRTDGDDDEEVTGEVDLDDDLIEDVVLSSLLNEEREIFIGNEFFKYTEMGLFFCDSDNKDLLLQYLLSLNPSQRIDIKEMSLLIPDQENGEIPTKITKLPTGVGQFVFNTSSSQSTLNIYILGYNVTNQNVNQVIDLAVNQMVNGIQSYLEKQEIITKIQNGSLKYNLINAVPFSNKVSVVTTDVKWYSNNDNKITHYFDFNFLFTWKSNYQDVGDYLQGLFGSTPYKNVKADIYGAAYRNGQWAGSRLIYNK